TAGAEYPAQARDVLRVVHGFGECRAGRNLADQTAARRDRLGDIADRAAASDGEDADGRRGRGLWVWPRRRPARRRPLPRRLRRGRPWASRSRLLHAERSVVRLAAYVLPRSHREGAHARRRGWYASDERGAKDPRPRDRAGQSLA